MASLTTHSMRGKPIQRQFFQKRQAILDDLLGSKFQKLDDGSMKRVIQTTDDDAVPEAVYHQKDRVYKPNSKFPRPRKSIKQIRSPLDTFVTKPLPEPSIPSASTSEQVSFCEGLLGVLLGASCVNEIPRSECVDDALKEYPEIAAEGSYRRLAEDIVKQWSPGAWEFIMSCGEDNSLPLYEKNDMDPGLYVDVIKFSKYKHYGPHVKLYGGMARNLFERIRLHQYEKHRQEHPALHYSLGLNLPYAQSTFYIFAKYPLSDEGVLLLGEAVMINALGMCERRSLYKVLADFGVPNCQNGPHKPIMGLNGDAGLRSGGYTHEQAAVARDLQMQKRLVNLVTTGMPVSIQRASKSSSAFGLLRNEKVYVDNSFFTGKQVNAIAFIDLTPGDKHPHAMYQWDSRHPELQQFGVWIEMPDGKPGFWIIGNNNHISHLRYVPKISTRFKRIATIVCEEYGLIARGKYSFEKKK